MIVLDFDDFVPEEKIIKLKGKNFNVTEIPFEIALKFNEAMPIVTALSKSENISDEEKEKLLTLIFLVFKLSDPELDYEWLKKQITFQKFYKIVEVLTNAMFAEDKKKEVNQELQEI